MKEPIYHIIQKSIRNGILPPGFSLPDDDSGASSICWAPGAMDGVCIYHMQHREPDADSLRQMSEALETASNGNFPKAEVLFAAWTEKCRAVNVVNTLRNYIIDHEDELDTGNIFGFGVHLIRHSTNIECVKIGLELLTLFDTSNDILRKIICRLGLYDEFTLFAVLNMLNWDDGNQYVFDLAKKVHGWGRIHAVPALKPETDEIKHWLLTEGTINDVDNAYSALLCWEKSDAETILFGNPSTEEYKGISRIIDGLISEGPVRGISAIENAETVLLRFLEISHNDSSYDLDRELISSINDWAASFEEPKTEIIKACGELLLNRSDSMNNNGQENE